MVSRAKKATGGYATVNADLLHVVIDNIDMNDPSAVDTVREVISQPHCDAGDAYKVFWWYAPHHTNLRLDQERFSDLKYVNQYGVFEEVGKLAFDGFYKSSKYLRDATFHRSRKDNEYDIKMLDEKITEGFSSGKIDWKLSSFLKFSWDDMEEAIATQHAVRVEVVGDTVSLNAVRNLQGKLENFLDGNPVGLCDGHAIGGDEAIIYLYGPDAEALFTAVKHILREDPIGCNAVVKLRCGLDKTEFGEWPIYLSKTHTANTNVRDADHGRFSSIRRFANRVRRMLKNG